MRAGDLPRALALTATMKELALSRTSSMRQIILGSLALAVILLPAAVFSIVATTSWEVVLLRALALVSLSLLAVLPWVATAAIDTRRRMRRWSIPGVAASSIYLISADPVYLILGFCLLSGATLDVWTARAHIASETLRARLRPTESRRP